MVIQALLRRKTKAFADWKASGGTDLIPPSVTQAADLEVEMLRNQGFTNQDILEGKALINYNNGGNAGNGNAGGPNKMLLIGGAIAAVALLVLVLRK
jgi:hypothetical protein